MRTVLLDKARHDRARFDCGVDVLNRYLQVMASQQAKKDNTRTFVLEDEQNQSYIVGFYTLTMTQIQLDSLPIDLQKRHHASTAGGLIARLAIDTRYKGQGFGEYLLIEALKRLLQASDSIGFPLVIVDAKEEAKAFYLQYGFTAFYDSKEKLFMTIADIRANFS